MTMRVRYAPSPTGGLHLGNARTALYNWLYAQRHGGTFILRIEDTDAERNTPQHEADILVDLRWLGLLWDEGPEVGGGHGPYRQSERVGLYEAAAERLLQAGRVYPCFCSEADLDTLRNAAKAQGKAFVYPGTCAAIPAEQARARMAGEAHTLRFRVRPGAVTFEDAIRGAMQVDTATLGDLVIRRSDTRNGGGFVYNFCCVVDDAAMEITHVIRGEDHLTNTAKQILFYEALGANHPSFAHLPMVLGPDGSKLSKRHGATSVGEFRAEGYTPEALCQSLALVGWTPESGADGILGMEGMSMQFDLSHVQKSGGIFDRARLDHFNGLHLRSLSHLALGERLRPFLVDGHVWPVEAVAHDGAALARVAEVFATAGNTLLAQACSAQAALCWDAEHVAAARAGVTADAGEDVVRALLEELPSPVPDGAAFKAAMERVKAKTGKKGKALFHPVRWALTGRSDGPEMALLIPLLDFLAPLVPGVAAPKARLASVLS